MPQFNHRLLTRYTNIPLKECASWHDKISEARSRLLAVSSAIRGIFFAGAGHFQASVCPGECCRQTPPLSLARARRRALCEKQCDCFWLMRKAATRPLEGLVSGINTRSPRLLTVVNSTLIHCARGRIRGRLGDVAVSPAVRPFVRPASRRQNRIPAVNYGC